jgi:hypothetical protein
VGAAMTAEMVASQCLILGISVVPPRWPLRLPMPPGSMPTPSSLFRSGGQSSQHPVPGLRRAGPYVMTKLTSNSDISCSGRHFEGLCHACQLGRHTCIPFASSSSRAE